MPPVATVRLNPAASRCERRSTEYVLLALLCRCQFAISSWNSATSGFLGLKTKAGWYGSLIAATPPGTKHPAHLTQGTRRVADVLNHEMCDGDVESSIGRRDFVYRGLLETNIAYAAFGSRCARNCQLTRFDVDSDHLARAYRFSKSKRDRARSAPAVDQVLTRRQVRKEKRQLTLGCSRFHPATGPILVAMQVTLA
jgi:hypothetical protein